MARDSHPSLAIKTTLSSDFLGTKGYTSSLAEGSGGDREVTHTKQVEICPINFSLGPEIQKEEDGWLHVGCRSSRCFISAPTLDIEG